MIGKVKAIVTDIEGTTSSLSFVKDVLFPYARERIGHFIRQYGDEPRVRQVLEEAVEAAGRPLTREQLIEQLIAWIDEDRKVTPLKALQGMIWDAGYRQGDFTGHVYEDAVQGLRRWKAAGLELYVFSSGSVHAQKLLFGHSDHGDLTPLFSGYYDTNIGSKREPDAYRAIAADIGLEPPQVLFLSDIKEELDAARAAGMQTLWLVRGEQADVCAPHRQVEDFGAILNDGR